MSQLEPNVSQCSCLAWLFIAGISQAAYHCCYQQTVKGWSAAEATNACVSTKWSRLKVSGKQFSVRARETGFSQEILAQHVQGIIWYQLRDFDTVSHLGQSGSGNLYHYSTERWPHSLLITSSKCSSRFFEPELCSSIQADPVRSCHKRSVWWNSQGVRGALQYWWSWGSHYWAVGTACLEEEWTLIVESVGKSTY